MNNNFSSEIDTDIAPKEKLPDTLKLHLEFRSYEFVRINEAFDVSEFCRRIFS